MPRRHGYALLAALAAVVVLISSGIFALTGPAGRDGTARNGSATHTADKGGRSGSGGTGLRPAASAQWIGTWSASPVGPEPRSGKGLAGQSIRNVVHTSIGGTRARITLSNLFGNKPLHISHASIAVAAAAGAPAAEPGTMRPVTFRGRPTVVVPPGGQAVSDGTAIRVPYDGDLLVSVFSQSPSGSVTHHPFSRQTGYSAAGDHTEDVSGGAYKARTKSWRYLTRVDVLNPHAEGAVVLFGDSITDGISSSLDANRRWPDVLSDRLRAEPGAPRYGVLNQGISGNRLLNDHRGPSGLSRFQRDAVKQPGARTIVVLLGINDIIAPPNERDAKRITDGLRELVRQGHARQQRVIGSTLLPFGGHPTWTAELEAVRERVNTEIRAGRVFDAVIDFDRAVRDPYAPVRMLPAYDSGDHLHPSDEGYRRMGQWVDLGMLRAGDPGAAAGAAGFAGREGAVAAPVRF
ncbi:SGNH/GDSL hydrolase family protein [Streptomyces candidus]|uniref:Lysophospholipase L1-like esterase n=1 Tax=Streptomyces candidus TaxID=67283 RepID=A0A7X0LPV6_9ACTN|nr:SGNH/GDSL hydrolase family protein [Streptomyces candidus]MBB6436933.1 lysophospholipase L1-like esterase [Streptomyces candidus]GHH32304.1 SGNH hydrolase [Streptomyces candidus]